MGRRSGHTSAQQRDAVLAVLTKRKTISEVCRELAVSAEVGPKGSPRQCCG